MKAEVIISHIRTRAKDDKANDFKFSTAYLLDLLSLYQNKFILEFDYDIVEFEKELFEKDEGLLRLPFEILALKAAFLDAKRLQIATKNYVLKGFEPFEHFLVQENNKAYRLFGAKSGKIRLFVLKKAELNALDDELILDESFLNLLVFSILRDLVSIESDQSFLQKTQMYEKLIELEKNNLKAQTNAKRSQTCFFLPFVKV